MARHCHICRLALASVVASACASKPDEPTPAESTDMPADPVIRRVAHALEQNDLDGARQALENDRWLASDRGRAALLYYDCLLAQNQFAQGIDSLRAYLEKTARLKTPADETAERLLAHHAGGGDLQPKGDDDAGHFGLYALVGLNEKETARPMLETAARHAESPERLVAQWALSNLYGDRP